MTNINPNIKYSADNSTLQSQGTLVVFCDAKNNFAPTLKLLKLQEFAKKASKNEKFNGKFGKKLTIFNATTAKMQKIVIIGLGKIDELNAYKYNQLGGIIASLKIASEKLSVITDLPTKPFDLDFDAIANIALGIKLGAYRFTRHKTSKDVAVKNITYTLYGKNARKASIAWNNNHQHIANGVLFARELTNEPANILTPAEFVKRARQLKKLGAKVKVLDKKAMEKLKMNALLGVALGSENPPYMVVIEWNGARSKKQRPLAFIGKGVTFDTGGISLKPAGGMEDMRGDMGGAAAVAGLMHTLAARRAKVHAVGLLGLVENMPDAKAQRPGDIVTSMSGKTIEVLNTDAEGRLVLADVLHYAQKKLKPKMMVNLATLTGAILVALGNEHAGLFSNNDKLAKNLFAAGQTTSERVWRLPLDKAYDKLIDSKNADVKNIGGGRYAGSITAAQFLQRFVSKKIPWAHLDIAGTAFDSQKNEINKSWGTGFGVRLLNELVANYYEK